MSSATRYVLILIILLNLITLFISLYFPPQPHQDDSYGSSTMVVPEGQGHAGAQPSPRATAPRPGSSAKEPLQRVATGSPTVRRPIQNPLMTTTSPIKTMTPPTLRPTAKSLSPTRRTQSPTIATSRPTIQTMSPSLNKLNIARPDKDNARETDDDVADRPEDEEDAIDDQLVKHREELVDELGEEAMTEDDEDRDEAVGDRGSEAEDGDGGEEEKLNNFSQLEGDDDEEATEALAELDSMVEEPNQSASFRASPQQQRDCLEDYKRNRQQLIPKKPHPTVHDRLADLLARFSELSACKTTKRFVLLGTPHFGGGRILYDTYLRRRNWTNLRIEIPLSNNISALDVIPKDTVLLLAACQRVLPVRHIQQELGVGLISMAPRERVHVLKIPFFLSIRKLFDEGLRCDYRKFHPETFLVESASQCRFFATTVLKRSNASDIWFIKSGRESFGDGIAVRTTEKALNNEFSDDSCQMAFHNKGGPKIPRILIQRKVENILMINERNTQGRSYFLISSYDPATVWFFMGYFNVAGSLANQGDADDKAAHVTNLRSNQDSKRLLFHEFMAGRTLEEMSLLNDNIKRAALTAFLALKSSLGANSGSFSLFGFDFLVQRDLQVTVLETNCNCELFVDAKRFGRERVQLSSALMRGMMDIVLAENLNRKTFPTLIQSFIQKNDMRNVRDSIDLAADGDQSERRRSWELIYTELVKPPFMFTTNASQLCGNA